MLAANPAQHLACYLAKITKKAIPQVGCGCNTAVDPKCAGVAIVPAQVAAPPVQVFLNNQFGPETVTTKKLREVCIPTIKTVLP